MLTGTPFIYALCLSGFYDSYRIELVSRSINDPDTSVCCRAERIVQARLDAGCSAPAGAHATLHKGVVTVHAFVGDPNATRILRASESGPQADAESVAERVAERLIEDGANELLASVRQANE